MSDPYFRPRPKGSSTVAAPTKRCWGSEATVGAPELPAA